MKGSVLFICTLLVATSGSFGSLRFDNPTFLVHGMEMLASIRTPNLAVLWKGKIASDLVVPQKTPMA